MVEPLAEGKADLAVAPTRSDRPGSGAVGRRRRRARSPGRWSARPTSFAGLVAISAPLAREVSPGVRPGRLAVHGRPAVPVEGASGRGAGPSRRAVRRRSGSHFDDLRHLKRLADDRFGNASRLFQFCAVGASGMVVDLTLLRASSSSSSRGRGWRAGPAPLVGGSLDLAAAGALAIALALTWNFSLNRRLTFNYARGGSLVRQYLTYALSNALGIALSFSLRLYLPAHVGFFQRHRLAAAVVGIVTATGISFTMSRWLVFRRRPPVPPAPARAERPRRVVDRRAGRDGSRRPDVRARCDSSQARDAGLAGKRTRPADEIGTGSCCGTRRIASRGRSGRGRSPLGSSGSIGRPINTGCRRRRSRRRRHGSPPPPP